MRQFSNIKGYSGRYFSNKGVLGTGPGRVSDVVYTVIVDGHPRLQDFLLTWNSEKGWLKEEFDEKDVAFVKAVQEEIDREQHR